MKKLPQPNQPIVLDEDDRPRFQKNSLVRWLLDAGPLDLSQLRNMPNLDLDDWTQLMQLIGYSVDGYAELSTSPRDRVAWADAEAEKLRQSKENGNATGSP
jgi:hypothetical protein